MDATQDHPWLPCPNCGPGGWAARLVYLALSDSRLRDVTKPMIDAIATAARKRLEEET